MKKVKNLCGTLFLMIVIWNINGTTLLANNSTITLKVGFYKLDGFFEYDKDGNECGYGVDFLNQISQYSNIKFEYVPIENWEDNFSMLNSGAIDLVAPVSSEKMTNSNYQYSNESIIYTFMSILTLENRGDLFYNDIEQLDKIKIGITSSSLRDNATLNYFKNRGITPEFVEFPLYKQCEDALRNGQVDALVSNIMDYKNDMKILARYSPVQNYFVMRKGDSRMTTINDALCSIQLEHPSFSVDLYQSYYPERNITPLTKEEVLYIGEKKSLKVGVYTNNRPLSYYNKKTKDYEGILIDVMRLIEDKTKLSLEIVPIKSNKTLTESLESGDVDIIIPSTEGSYESDNAEYSAYMSEDFLNTQVVFAKLRQVKLNSREQLVVGIPIQYEATRATLEKNYPNIKIITYQKQEDCLKALKKGQIEAIAYDAFTMGYLLQSPYYSNINIIPVLSRDMHLCITASKELDNAAISIINKGLSTLNQTELDIIVNRHTMLEQYEMGWKDFLYKYRYYYSVGIVILAVIITVFLIYNIQRSRFYRAIEIKNEEVRKANEAKSDFLSNVSHDMRTPMNAIIGLSDIVLTEKLDLEVVTDYITKIHSSGHYLLELINDVLDVSKIEGRKLVLYPEIVNIEELCEEIKVIIYPQIQKKHIALTFVSQEFGLKYARLDRVRTKQIFLNLLSNSVKFTPDYGKIECTLERISQHQNRIRERISIQDNGIGMSEEFLSKIFLPFEQEHGGSTTSYTGTGLGMSIVKKIIDLMNGSIEVQSRQGVGTKFIVELDIELVDKAVGQEEKMPIPMQWDFRGKHILLCEDHEVNAKIAEKLLDNVGFSVTVAVNGQEGLQLFEASKEGHFDAVLMDIRMPILDGLEATKQIRLLKREDAGRVPIIAMTANAFDEDREKSKEVGMDNHLTKPIDQQSMYRVLFESINKAGSKE